MPIVTYMTASHDGHDVYVIFDVHVTLFHIMMYMT